MVGLPEEGVAVGTCAVGGGEFGWLGGDGGGEAPGSGFRGEGLSTGEEESGWWRRHGCGLAVVGAAYGNATSLGLTQIDGAASPPRHPSSAQHPILAATSIIPCHPRIN